MTNLHCKPHQDCLIKHIELMNIDGSKEFYKATQFLAILKADENVPPSEESITESESSHYQNNCPVQIMYKGTYQKSSSKGHFTY